MGHNHLEQLVAEWYEYQGYFVRKNVNVGKRPQGGYECELDVVAFHPETKQLVQIEPSLDAESWPKREIRYRKKFDAGRKYIPQIFNGLEIPTRIEQIALFLFASKTNHQVIAGGKIMLVSELMATISVELSKFKVARQAMPEQFPILRTIQFIMEYRSPIFEALKLTVKD
jgi:hypothetical protein